MDLDFKEFAVLAVTKLGEELCVAGVDKNKRWIRPTSFGPGGWRQFRKCDVFDKNKNAVIALSNVVILKVLAFIPESYAPHIEDWEYDRTTKPVLVKTLDDRGRLKLFNSVREHSLEPLLEAQERSMCLIEPASIISADFSNRSHSGKYQPILGFGFRGESYSFKVTDIYWRAIGRNFPGECLDGDSLRRALKVERMFLSVGLTRKYQGQYWPMVIGVHLIPDFPVKIDYQNL